MKTFKDIVIPAKPQETRRIEDTIICDLCKKQITGACGYGIDEVRVENDKGDRYPERSYVVKQYFDICGPCFRDKIVPMLATLGAVSSTENEED